MAYPRARKVIKRTRVVGSVCASSVRFLSSPHHRTQKEGTTSCPSR
jgi:hypothetical protein